MSFAPSGPFDAAMLETVVGVASARAREDGRIELNLSDESVLDVLAWLSAHDIRPRRLRVVDSTLDDAFLDLTSQGGEDD